MATAATLEAVEHMLTCSVCLDTFDKGAHLPKYLSCHHTICLQCLKSIKGTRLYVGCPLCRQRTSTITNSDLNLLATNPFIEPLSLLASKKDQPSSSSALKKYRDDVKRLGASSHLHLSSITSLLEFASENISENDLKKGQASLAVIKRELSNVQQLLETGKSPVTADDDAVKVDINSNTFSMTVLSAQDNRKLGVVVIQPDGRFEGLVNPFVHSLGTFCNNSSSSFDASVENNVIVKFKQQSGMIVPAPESLSAVHILAGHPLEVGLVETYGSHFKLQLLVDAPPMFQQRYPLFGRIVGGQDIVKSWVPKYPPSPVDFKVNIRYGKV